MGSGSSLEKPKKTENCDSSWSVLDYESVKNAVAKGDKKAKTKLAWMMLSGLGGAVIDEDGATEMLQEQVKKGDADAMWLLGVCNEYGIGNEQNIERAESLYKQSDDKKNQIGHFFISHKDCRRGSGKVKILSL